MSNRISLNEVLEHLNQQRENASLFPSFPTQKTIRGIYTIAYNAVNRFIPLPVIEDVDNGAIVCQRCGLHGGLFNGRGDHNDFCGLCGQRLDWDEFMDREDDPEEYED